MSIRIYLTGRVALEIYRQEAVLERQFRGKQGSLLFVYLVCERARPVSRGELAVVHWPENQSLSREVALSAPRNRLVAWMSAGELKARGVSFYLSQGQYQLRLPSDVWVTWKQASWPWTGPSGIVRAGYAERALGPSTVAASIERWPILPGVEGFWMESLRAKLER